MGTRTLPVILSDHARLRIAERMHINERSVLDRITNNIYVDVCERKISVSVTYRYMVLWDELARRPYVIVLAEDPEFLTLVTVLPYLAQELRKHDVVVTEEHTRSAKEAFRVYENTYRVEVHLHVTTHHTNARGPTKTLRLLRGLLRVSRTKWLLHEGSVASFVATHGSRRMLDSTALPQFGKAVLHLECLGLDGIKLEEVIFESIPSATEQ